SAGSMVQHRRLLYSRLMVQESMLINVQRGRKRLRWAGHELFVEAGEAVVLDGGQTFDVINEPDSDGLYQAQWIAFGQTVIERFAAQYGAAEKAVRDAVKLTHYEKTAASFAHAAGLLADAHAPAAAVETALHGLLAWLQHEGIGFTVCQRIDLIRQIRKMIAADTAFLWTAAEAAARLNFSETTLRRRLAQENTSFRSLLIDVRMMRALTLLQVTEWPVEKIADAVGYESASRFTARFKERFGFVPSAVRGGETAAAEYRRGEVVNVGVQP
ncbi:MAG: helix-turn-helix transcriptional regulator, partial [Neisseria sp.]|uniref:helix-turn-helix transcriptional regulator n=1 Tax=Neisseria sp. TaxID=192066 RepID=UPI0026DB1598